MKANFIYDDINTEFEFSSETYEKCNEVLKNYPSNKKRAALLPVLHIVQEQNQGWLSSSSLISVAKFLGISEMDVFSVASFYELYRTEKVGKNIIYVCRTTPCWLRGSDNVKNVLEKILQIKVGQTTSDNLFSLFEIECLGACINAPVIKINNNYYENVDEGKIKDIINSIVEKGNINNASKE